MLILLLQYHLPVWARLLLRDYCLASYILAFLAKIMSSPPTSATSTKPAKVSTSNGRLRERSASFPSIAALNPFKKKPERHSPILREPYQVAPDIWSTDATAKVFGYLDESKKGSNARSRSTGPEERNQGQTPTSARKSLSAKSLLNRFREAHTDDGTDDFTTRTHRQHVEASDRSRQSKRDAARREREESQRRGERGKMRTVSKEDELTERGANPRTGIVSPFVMSEDGRGSSDLDYVAVGNNRALQRPVNRKTSSGRWKQNDGGWNLVESPVPEPVNPITSTKSKRKISVKKLEDKLLVEMPGADNPEPNNMTDDQMRRYQQSIQRAYKHGGGSHAMVDPETLPSPREWTPEGPSTPPTRLHKVQRKEVGSGPSPKNGSNDTVIKKSSPPTRPILPSRTDIRESQKVRLITPSQADRGNPPRTPLDEEDPFLGQGQQYDMKANEITPPSPSIKQQTLNYQSPPEGKTVPEAPCETRPTSPNLSQYLPRLHLLHPSHFANLIHPSYRRPTQLLPARLRPSSEQRKAEENACTITTTTTIPPNPAAKKNPRPRLQRQEGSKDIPETSSGVRTVSNGPHRAIEIFQEKSNGVHKASPLDLDDKASLETRSHAGPQARQIRTILKPAVDTSGTIRRSVHQSPSYAAQADRIATLKGAEYAAKAAMFDENLIQRHRGQEAQKTLELTKPSPGLTTHRTGIGSEVIPSRSIGGIIPTYDHHGERMCGSFRNRPTASASYLGEGRVPQEFATDYREGGVCFAGNWAEADKYDSEPDSTGVQEAASVARRRSMARQFADVKRGLYAAENWLQISTQFARIQHHLWRMVACVLSTLHHASPAIQVLQTSHASAQEYLTAVKDVGLAVVYLFVLLNLLMALRRVLLLVAKVVWFTSHPLRMVFVVVQWCVLG